MTLASQSLLWQMAWTLLSLVSNFISL
uniref:Uncharacterized protein n=1 Tax=Anguilla anguilla TaxID=7936 RepID=A0A0E9T0J3_ANGAN